MKSHWIASRRTPAQSYTLGLRKGSRAHLAVQSSLAVIRVRPANWRSHSLEVWPLSTSRSSVGDTPADDALLPPSEMSHRRTVRSSEPDARLLPSGAHLSLCSHQNFIFRSGEIDSVYPGSLIGQNSGLKFVQ